MMDYSVQRTNMVDSQLRPNGITDRRILDSMGALPREVFVEPARRPVAYADADVALGHGRVLMQPMALARLVHLAAVSGGERVLHVGAGSGYATALLASLGRSVLALEENPELAAAAAERLRQLAVGNATVVPGRHALGHAGGVPYDVIFIEGRIPFVPETLTAQLAQGGRLVAAVGERQVARATLITRHGAGASARGAFDVTAAALPGIAAQKPEFVF